MRPGGTVQGFFCRSDLSWLKPSKPGKCKSKPGHPFKTENSPLFLSAGELLENLQSEKSEQIKRFVLINFK
jgi:hypothetical protein